MLLSLLSLVLLLKNMTKVSQCTAIMTYISEFRHERLILQPEVVLLTVKLQLQVLILLQDDLHFLR